MLLGMGAQVTGIPEIACTEDDAKGLAQAWQNVARHYAMESTQKSFDWLMAGMMTSGFIGIRYFAYKDRRAAEEQAKRGPRNPPATVYPLNVN